jgi:hypothetical protein
MLHHFVATEVPRNMNAMNTKEAAMGILSKLKLMKWKDMASILALIYDLDFVGGAKFLRTKKGMGEMFKTVLTSHTPALRERYINRHQLGGIGKRPDDSKGDGAGEWMFPECSLRKQCNRHQLGGIGKRPDDSKGDGAGEWMFPECRPNVP